MSIKITAIGAGSIGFTRKLMGDILTVPELADTKFAFTDISQQNLDMVTQLCQRDIESNGVPATLESTVDRRRALADADYALRRFLGQGGLGVPDRHRYSAQVRRGPVRRRYDLCRRHHVRPAHHPALLDFCKDIREVAKPGALLPQLSNPMAMNTWACNKYGGVPTIGLCHGVQGAHWQIAAAIEQWAGRRLLGPEKDCTATMSTSSAPASTTRPGASRPSGAESI